MPDTYNAILVLNSGSSSLKFGLFTPANNNNDEQLILEGSADNIGRDSGSLRIRNAAGDDLLRRDHILSPNPKHSPPSSKPCAISPTPLLSPSAIASSTAARICASIGASLRRCSTRCAPPSTLRRCTSRHRSRSSPDPEALPADPRLRLLRHRLPPHPARGPHTYPSPRASASRRPALRLPRPLLRIRRRGLAPHSRRASSSRISATAPASAPSSTAAPSTPPWASRPPAASPWAPAAATSTPASSSSSSATNT